MYVIKEGNDTAGSSSTRSLFSLGAALPTLPAGGEYSGHLWNIRMSLLQCFRRCFLGQALWRSAMSCPAAGSPVKHGEPCMGRGYFRAVVYPCGVLPIHHLVSELAQPEPSVSSGLTKQFIGMSVSFWEVRMPLSVPSVINTALFSIPSQAGSTHKFSGCLGICACTQVRSCSENSCVSGTHHLQHQKSHYKEELKNKLHFL